MEITINETSPMDMLISFKGKFDTIAAQQAGVDLEPVMSILRTTPMNITLDLSEMTYIASAGLRIILILQKATKAKDATLVIQGMSPDVYDIFDITGLNRSIIIK